MQAIVQQARFESIKTNRPMVVSIDAVARTVSVTSATNAAMVACSGATPVRTVLFSETERVAVLPDDFSIVWLPSGQPRMCNGSPVSLAGVGVGLTDGYRSVSVNVGAGGEVVVQ